MKKILTCITLAITTHLIAADAGREFLPTETTRTAGNNLGTVVDSYEKHTQFLINALHKGGHVVEIGGNDAWHLQYVLAKSKDGTDFHYTGIDLSERGFTRLRNKMKNKEAELQRLEEEKKIQLIKGFAQDELPKLADESVHVFSAAFVFHFLSAEDVTNILAQMDRLLTDNGAFSFVFSTPLFTEEDKESYIMEGLLATKEEIEGRVVSSYKHPLSLFTNWLDRHNFEYEIFPTRNLPRSLRSYNVMLGYRK